MVVSKDEILKNRSRMNDLLEKLKKKLRAFGVINLQGQVIGRIKDFTLYRYRRLYMVIPQSDEQTDSPVFLLSSKYIQKVDPSNRAVFVDLSLAEVERLPVYHSSKDKGTERLVYSQTPPGTQTINTNSGETRAFSETQPSVSQFSARENLEEVDNESFTDSDDTTDVAEEETVRLLEERLIVNRNKWKVGEVVVRKGVETEIVQVPVRREKLIIEQVGAETKQLLEIDLGQGEVSGVEQANASSSDKLAREVSSSDQGYTVIGEFLSPKAASNLLEAIGLQGRHGCQKVRVELVLDNPELQETYQNMFDRCSTR